MARIHELLRQLRATGSANAALADDIEREYNVIADRRAFGLNFERHTPEAVELPGRPVRTGDKVHLLPPRGAIPTREYDRLWRVTAIDGNGADSVAHLEPYPLADDMETTTQQVSEIVVVAEFRDPIYPGLVSSGRVERGVDKPYHAVINGENFHALQTLLFTHSGKVDAIYIDPPYNTGAKDWKYNNNYVESDDLYRHSKWLAFMERRLLLAKELLNPDDSVLIVTIDEKEYLRLGMLLEQTFPEATSQMITTVIKPGGTSRTKEFSRVEEFAYFVFIGAAELTRTTDNMLAASDQATTDDETSTGLTESDLWEGMIRRGIGVVRSQREGQFYPIFIDAERGALVEIGEPLGRGVSKESIAPRPGLTTVWPIKDDLTEGFWQLGPDGFWNARKQGTIRVGSFNSKTGHWRIQYMKAKKAKAVVDGLVSTLGLDENGVVILDLENSELSDLSTPRTVWNKTSHDASTGGAGLLNKVLPRRKFPFAKSLYAVEDSLRFFVGNKTDAVIVDFFSGSGTTAHAVMRLNKQDNGNRISISVTNNEVSADEQKGLRDQHLRPGDEGWESWGICEYITKPRIKAAITGLTPDGEPISGAYKFTDEFPIAAGFEENVEFFTLTYEAPLRLRMNRDFKRVAPLLWLRSGSRGARIESLTDGWAVADAYGIIADLDKTSDFLVAIEAMPGVTHAFVITDDDSLFEAIVSELPDCIEPVRLYDEYLRNFEIDAMRGVR